MSNGNEGIKKTVFQAVVAIDCASFDEATAYVDKMHKLVDETRITAYINQIDVET